MVLCRGPAVLPKGCRHLFGWRHKQPKADILRGQREGQMLWKPRKGKIVSSWRNQERSPEKVAFESGLEGRGLFCEKEEIKKIKSCVLIFY